MQSEALVARYKDQWREVAGRIRGVKRLNSVVSSVGCDDPDQVHVTCFFDPNEWDSRLGGLMPNDEIRVVGKVRHVSESLVILDDCELVQV